MLYYDWKPIGADPAQRALDKGGKIWKLQVQFGNGMARFSYGLETKRGACYVVSDRVFAALAVPAGAWPQLPEPAIGNHRSPFGMGA